MQLSIRPTVTGYALCGVDSRVIARVPIGDQSAAELIVRAVNAHDELLAALLALADRVAVVIESDADDGKPEDAELRTAWDAAGVAIARAAIARAEGAQ